MVSKSSTIQVRINGPLESSFFFLEFLLSTIQLKEMLTRDMLRAAFRMFDLDNDGWVTFEEIRAVLIGNGIQEVCEWQTLLA